MCSRFSKVFDRLDRILIFKWLLFVYQKAFLYTGAVSANLKIDRKVDKVIHLFTKHNFKEGNNSTSGFIVFLHASVELGAVLKEKLKLLFFKVCFDTCVILLFKY